MTSNDQRLTVRELSHRADDLELLERFYEQIYLAEFPIRDERESLQNMKNYLRLRAEGWYGRNNYHVLLGLCGGAPAAGAFVDYLDEPNSATLEFLAVSRALRGGGFGRQLLDEIEKRVAADAAALGKPGMDVIVAEMNDPFRESKDSMDPFVRTAIWDRWGYRRLDFPYVQPALSKDKASVDNLVLIAKPCRPEFNSGLPATKVRDILRNYMRWAMRIERPENNPEYQHMSRYLAGIEMVPMLGLGAYTGHDAARPLFIHELAGPADSELASGLAVYALAFPEGRAAITADGFRAALSADALKSRDMRYHFWTMRSTESAPVEGMASFFTFPDAGFGGYIALEGTLRGSGRFPLLLARIEERMLRDAVGAHGWYIECNPRQERLFTRHGFYTVDLNYAQPPLPGCETYAAGEAPPLLLMYKTFGRSYGAPTLSVKAFCASLEHIFRTVYALEDVPRSPFYGRLCAQASNWPGAQVGFRVSSP